MRTEQTTWELWTYDVWGNPDDGYEVNDRCRHGSVEIDCPIEVYNEGTPMEFRGASPTDKQIRAAFGVRCAIDTDGDDVTIYVNRERDGYPIGELLCVSHESLSPIRRRVE